jgi:hypothetical protein
MRGIALIFALIINLLLLLALISVGSFRPKTQQANESSLRLELIQKPRAADPSHVQPRLSGQRARLKQPSPIAISKQRRLELKPLSNSSAPVANTPPLDLSYTVPDEPVQAQALLKAAPLFDGKSKLKFEVLDSSLGGKLQRLFQRSDCAELRSALRQRGSESTVMATMERRGCAN